MNDRTYQIIIDGMAAKGLTLCSDQGNDRGYRDYLWAEVGALKAIEVDQATLLSVMEVVCDVFGDECEISIDRGGFLAHFKALFL